MVAAQSARLIQKYSPRYTIILSQTTCSILWSPRPSTSHVGRVREAGPSLHSKTNKHFFLLLLHCCFSLRTLLGRVEHQTVSPSTLPCPNAHTTINPLITRAISSFPIRYRYISYVQFSSLGTDDVHRFTQHNLPTTCNDLRSSDCTGTGLYGRSPGAPRGPRCEVLTVPPRLRKSFYDHRHQLELTRACSYIYVAESEIQIERREARITVALLDWLECQSTVNDVLHYSELLPSQCQRNLPLEMNGGCVRRFDCGGSRSLADLQQE